MFMKKLFSITLLFLLAYAAAGGETEGYERISSALEWLYCFFESLLPIVVFLLTIGAAIVYTAGQFLGAETRSRAAVWATAMIIGVIFGLMIWLVFPYLIKTMIPSATQPSCEGVLG